VAQRLAQATHNRLVAGSIPAGSTNGYFSLYNCIEEGGLMTGNYHDWIKSESIDNFNYVCGFCGKSAAPSKQYRDQHYGGKILICPNCTNPTYIDEHQNQFPKIRFGNDIQGITKEDVASLFKEARDCTSVGAYTASVMVCRKILMNIAVEQKAETNKPFAYYVDYLSDKGYIPPNGKPWVDTIRQRGNDANHEIILMTEQDAKLILHFTEALLRFIYELPDVLQKDIEKSNDNPKPTISVSPTNPGRQPN
jgi:uncharacterized CHY-type Zn-finger protein